MLLFGGYIEFVMSSLIAFIKPSEEYTFGKVKFSGEVVSYYASLIVFPVTIITSLVVAIWIIYQPKELLDTDKYT